MENRLAELGRRLLTLLRHGQFDADLEEEMRLRRSCHHILKAFHRDSTLHGGGDGLSADSTVRSRDIRSHERTVSAR
jgi:hypothetical protein